MKRILWITLALFLLCSCATPNAPGASGADSVSGATMERYRDGELRQYEGARLDPAIGPRDNSIKGIQQVDMTNYRLTIDGLVDTPQSLRYEDVKALPQQTKLITLHCVEGWDATILWKGVLMEDLVKSAGRQSQANTVIFHAVDGYTTSLPLADILQNKRMLAYEANGLPLPAEMGYPFIFVAEDKWGYKWARWVNRIELSSDADYEGYWEQNGYDNQADLPQDKR